MPYYDNYQILQVGDSIYVNNYELLINSIEPADVVSTFNTDPVVDFLPCREDELEEVERQEKLKLAIQEKLDQEKKIKDAVYQEKIKTETYLKTGYIYVPFGGVGNTSSNTSSKPITTNKEDIKPLVNKQIRKIINYKAFSGNGNKLGEK